MVLGQGNVLIYGTRDYMIELEQKIKKLEEENKKLNHALDLQEFDNDILQNNLETLGNNVCYNKELIKRRNEGNNKLVKLCKKHNIYCGKDLCHDVEGFVDVLDDRLTKLSEENKRLSNTIGIQQLEYNSKQDYIDRLENKVCNLENRKITADDVINYYEELLLKHKDKFSVIEFLQLKKEFIQSHIELKTLEELN